MFIVQSGNTVHGCFTTLKKAENHVHFLADAAGYQHVVTFEIWQVPLDGKGLKEWLESYQWWPKYTGHREWKYRENYVPSVPTQEEEFVAALLAGDPVAVDILNDILTGRK